ncbi:hypothetical protein [Staphylococcus succinus]|uniref:hypothetical protein n=1 Tax=Staphylococcus succinus TaxID=61015 RepID=UPI00301BD673
MNTINKIKGFLTAMVLNIVPLLFLLGLTIVNIACYIQWGLITGLIVSGLTLILIAIILVNEQSGQTK